MPGNTLDNMNVGVKLTHNPIEGVFASFHNRPQAEVWVNYFAEKSGYPRTYYEIVDIEKPNPDAKFTEAQLQATRYSAVEDYKQNTLWPAIEGTGADLTCGAVQSFMAEVEVQPPTETATFTVDITYTPSQGEPDYQSIREAIHAYLSVEEVEVS